MTNLTFDRLAIAEALQASVHEVLETMFFASVEGVSEPEGKLAAARFGAHLGFHGECSGEFGVAVDEAALATIAIDFLGRATPPATKEELAAVVCEMANMVCGNMLSRLEGDKVFRLESPQSDLGEQERSAPPGAVTGRFHLDPGGLLVWASLGNS